MRAATDPSVPSGQLLGSAFLRLVFLLRRCWSGAEGDVAEAEAAVDRLAPRSG